MSVDIIWPWSSKLRWAGHLDWKLKRHLGKGIRGRVDVVPDLAVANRVGVGWVEGGCGQFGEERSSPQFHSNGVSV